MTPGRESGAWHEERFPDAAVHRHDQALSPPSSVHWRDVVFPPSVQLSSNSDRSFTTRTDVLHDSSAGAG